METEKEKVKRKSPLSSFLIFLLKAIPKILIFSVIAFIIFIIIIIGGKLFKLLKKFLGWLDSFFTSIGKAFADLGKDLSGKNGTGPFFESWLGVIGVAGLVVGIILFRNRMSSGFKTGKKISDEVNTKRNINNNGCNKKPRLKGTLGNNCYTQEEEDQYDEEYSDENIARGGAVFNQVTQEIEAGGIPPAEANSLNELTNARVSAVDAMVNAEESGEDNYDETNDAIDAIDNEDDAYGDTLLRYRPDIYYRIYPPLTQ